MCIRTIEELEQDTREKQVIDIRDKADFEKETYPDAINIYWEELEEHMNEIRKDCPCFTRDEHTHYGKILERSMARPL